MFFTFGNVNESSSSFIGIMDGIKLIVVKNRFAVAISILSAIVPEI